MLVEPLTLPCVPLVVPLTLPCWPLVVTLPCWPLVVPLTLPCWPLVLPLTLPCCVPVSVLAVEPVVPMLPEAVAEPLEGWLLTEPCALVSAGTGLFAADVLLCAVVPVLAVACVPLAPPAVPCVPEIDPDCVVPVSVEAVVRVFLLLLLQPKTSAAASAIGNVTFICNPPRGVSRRLQ